MDRAKELIKRLSCLVLIVSQLKPLGTSWSVIKRLIKDAAVAEEPIKRPNYPNLEVNLLRSFGSLVKRLVKDVAIAVSCFILAINHLTRSWYVLARC